MIRRLRAQRRPRSDFTRAFIGFRSADLVAQVDITPTVERGRAECDGITADTAKSPRAAKGLAMNFPDTLRNCLTTESETCHCRRTARPSEPNRHRVPSLLLIPGEKPHSSQPMHASVKPTWYREEVAGDYARRITRHYAQLEVPALLSRKNGPQPRMYSRHHRSGVPNETSY
jgi:hypothetical protein